ncbi:MAG TPA: outer membrane protein transport protein, partial [Pseudomonadales bacterium]|nr:outer membrane protein transport protein [Pseudomonadales bacterium]
GRYISQRLAFTLMTYFSPTVAYQFSDTFSAGVALTFNYSGTGLELPFRYGADSVDQLARLNFAKCAATPGDAVCNQKVGLNDELGTLTMEVENTLSYGFNAGFLWQATPWMRVGVVYQSAVPMDMEGDFTWQNSTTWNNFYLPLLNQLGLSASNNGATKRGKAKVKMKLPENYAIGFSFTANPSWKINLDLKHSRWSQWAGIPLTFTQPLDFLQLASMVDPSNASPSSLNFPFKLKDTWNPAIGVTYQYSKITSLRFGVENRPSSIPKSSQSPLLPIGDGVLIGAGVGIQRPSGATMDLGIGYFSSNENMPGGSSILGNSDDPKKAIYNPYPGTDIKTELSYYLVELSYLFPF